MKKYFMYILCAALLPVQSVCASIIINEIMYDAEGTDTNREWIEVKNEGSESIDFSSWKFFEANANHSLVVSNGSPIIDPGGYAIIAAQPAGFLADWPAVTVPIFDSSFSLNNEIGESLALKDAGGEVIDDITYESSVGAAGNGNSLNRSGNNFIERSATPGESNSNSVNDVGEDDGNDEDPPEETDETNIVNSNGSSKKESTGASVSKLSLKIEAPTIATAGVPVLIDATMLGYEKESYRVGRFLWGMGDGSGFETESISKFWYTYEYPGEYVITLDFSFKKKEDKPDASARATILVTEPKVVISGINTKGPGSVEIKNISNREVELSKWVVRSGVLEFSIADNTVLLPGRTLTLNPKVTKFNTIASVALVVPTGQIVSSYPVANNFTAKASTPQKVAPSQVSGSTISKEYIPIKIPVENLTAGASRAASKSGSLNHSAWYLVGFLSISLLTLGFLYIRRMRHTAHSEADDFEITE